MYMSYDKCIHKHTYNYMHTCIHHRYSDIHMCDYVRSFPAGASRGARGLQTRDVGLWYLGQQPSGSPRCLDRAIVTMSETKICVHKCIYIGIYCIDFHVLHVIDCS